MDPKINKGGIQPEGLLAYALRSLVEEIVEERLKNAVPKCTIISVRTAAERYDIHPSTIYDWFGKGTIRKHIVGGRVYCFIEDFEKPKAHGNGVLGKG